jgi:hypothetical protein
MRVEGPICRLQDIAPYRARRSPPLFLEASRDGKKRIGRVAALAAGSSVSFQQATSCSFDQGALGIGLSVRYMGSSVKGSLRSKTSAEKLTITASFIQNAFTIGVDTPPNAAGWISDALTQERLQTYIASGTMGPDNLPVYVSDVTYGRIIMISITSAASESDIKCSLEATTVGSGAASWA